MRCFYSRTLYCDARLRVSLRLSDRANLHFIGVAFDRSLRILPASQLSSYLSYRSRQVLMLFWLISSCASVEPQLLLFLFTVVLKNAASLGSFADFSLEVFLCFDQIFALLHFVFLLLGRSLGEFEQFALYLLFLSLAELLIACGGQGACCSSCARSEGSRGVSCTRHWHNIHY